VMRVCAAEICVCAAVIRLCAAVICVWGGSDLCV
jgi:hypothetical protein